ncbi:hypothetical protein [Rhizobium phage RHEph12]|nr:hypothetical protein [Rhizobium phage RHEph12]
MRQMKPIVNISGTSREALVEARVEALTALRAAYEAVRQLAPHGRDYPNGGFADDRDLHHERCADLHNLIEEIEAEAFAINATPYIGG